MTGYPLAQLLQMNMAQLVAPEHHALIRERLRRRIAGELDEKMFEFEIQHRDGRRIWLELTTNGVCNPDGRLVAIQGVARDITERKQSEMMLRENEHRLHQVLKHARCILNSGEATGPDGWRERALEKHSPFLWNFPVVNEAAAQEMLPLEVRPGENYNGAWVRSRNPEDHWQMNHNSGAAFLQDSPFYRNEFRCTDKNGVEHWMQQHVTIRKLADNRWQLFGITTDISELKKAEKAVEERLKLETRLSMLADNSPGVIFAFRLRPDGSVASLRQRGHREMSGFRQNWWTTRCRSSN